MWMSVLVVLFWVAFILFSMLLCGVLAIVASMQLGMHVTVRHPHRNNQGYCRRCGIKLKTYRAVSSSGGGIELDEVHMECLKERGDGDS